MNFLSGILNGLGEIRAHKLRSALTVVSVMLGVAALVVVMGLLIGIFRESNEGFQEYGGLERIHILPDELPENQRHLQARVRGNTLADARGVARIARDVAGVVPSWRDELDVRRGANTLRVTLEAVPVGFIRPPQWRVERGRSITPLDERQRERVAVIGSTVARTCFPRGEEPLGGRIVLRDQPFRVVGVLERYERDYRGQNLLEDKNKTVFIPLETGLALFAESPRLSEFKVDATSVEAVPRVLDQVVNILVQAHQGLRDVQGQSNLQFFEQFARIQQTFFVVGGLVGGISLLVGGIGIMNLMMASVNERIREVGIRKAVGAWPRDIFVQFLAEAITLSGLGGVAGLALGWLVIDLLGRFAASQSPPVFSLGVAAVGFVFSVGVGVVAGLYPAWRAARMAPVEALRYE